MVDFISWFIDGLALTTYKISYRWFVWFVTNLAFDLCNLPKSFADSWHSKRVGNFSAVDSLLRNWSQLLSHQQSFGFTDHVYTSQKLSHWRAPEGWRITWEIISTRLYLSQTPIVRVVFFNISCFEKKTQARMVKDEKSGGKKHTYTIDEKGGYKNPQPPILDLQCPSSQVPKCPSAQVPKCPSAYTGPGDLDMRAAFEKTLFFPFRRNKYFVRLWSNDIRINGFLRFTMKTAKPCKGVFYRELL